ncbi:MAG: wax ester/triacylglycerol synthase family O-acyltransferase [Rhizobiaceae bacterium]
MRQLGGIDATFLYMETPETPMHVAGLQVFEPPVDFSGSFHAHFLDFFKSRMHLAPVFSQKLARTVLELDHPGWVDARDIDLDWHIRKATLPAPGTRAQLEALVGELHSVPLDRTRPLWQFTVIDGLDDGNAAIYTKVHHAAVDGGAGMVIAAAFFDISPKPRAVKPPEPKPEPKRKPTLEERALLGLNDLVQNAVRQHVDALQALPKIMNSVADLLSPKSTGDGKASPKLPGLPKLPEILPPKTPFNVTITGQRAFCARTLLLSDAKLIAKATGAKINDVVMAVCAGALRTWLEKRKALPDRSLVAFVPISLREAGNTDINNQVFGMNCRIATEIADPLARLDAIRQGADQAKTIAGGLKDVAPKSFTLLGAPLVLPGLMQLYGRSGLADIAPQAVNLVISNTPGPPFPMFCAGWKILAMYPVSIPVHGIGLNMTVQSYQNGLDFGLTADRRAMPDLDVLGDALAPAMEELKQAALQKAQ